MINFSTLLVLGGLLGLAGAASAQSVSFSSFTSYEMGQLCGPGAIIAADVNGDGKPDIITGNSYYSSAGVLLNNGNGTFPAIATLYPAGGTMSPYSTTSGLAVADLDGDGNRDLLVTNPGNNTVGMLKGNGNGTFQAPVTYSTGSSSQPGDIVLADMNGDGRPDLVTANYNSHKVGVLLGNANGTFQAVTEYATGASTGPTGLAVADVNGDGHADVLTVNSTNSVRMLLGTGTGTLQAAVTYTTVTATAYGIAVADMTSDGNPDLLLVDATNDRMGVMPGNGNGTFQPGSSYPTAYGPVKVTVADINGDGAPDVVTANNVGRATNLSNSSLSVLLGNGNGTFQTAISYGLYGKNNPVNVAVADVNADGRPDLLCAHYQANWILVFANTTPLATRATLPGTSATLHPNPASTSTTLALSGLPATVAQVQATLFDATGRAVGQQQLPVSQSTAYADVPTAGLAAGLYVLRLTAHDAQGQPIGSLPTQRLSVR